MATAATIILTSVESHSISTASESQSQQMDNNDRKKDSIVVATASQDDELHAKEQLLSVEHDYLPSMKSRIGHASIVILGDSTAVDSDGISPQVRRLMEELEKSCRTLFAFGVAAYVVGWLYIFLIDVDVYCFNCKTHLDRAGPNSDLLMMMYLLLDGIVAIGCYKCVSLLVMLHRERPDMFPKFQRPRCTEITMDCYSANVLLQNVRSDLGEICSCMCGLTQSAPEYFTQEGDLHEGLFANLHDYPEEQESA